MKLGMRSFLMVGMMAVLFIVVSKVLVNKYSVVPQGLKDVVNAV
ncbi:MAG TPA: hypothetical protein VF870_12300 [Ignavibacteriaceae bacterium]